MTAAPETSPTDAALRPGLDVALAVLSNRISRYEAIRREQRPHDAMGVIETELRDIVETLLARLKGKPVDAGPLFAPVEKPRRQVVCPECNGNPPFERGVSGWGCETCWSHGYILVEAAEEPLFGAIA